MRWETEIAPDYLPGAANDPKPNLNSIACMVHSICKNGIKDSFSSLASCAMPRR